MSIWKYEDNDREPELDIFWSRECIYCQSSLQMLPILAYKIGDNIVPDCWGPPFYDNSDDDTSYTLCLACGWWNVFKGEIFDTGKRLDEVWYGYSATLKELDTRDISIPIDEIRSYLIANYNERFSIPPWKFEQVVASVFKDLGYFARVTGRTGDGGIDVILDGPDDTLIGVQVKRYKNAINVEQIRSLSGALLLNGITRGVFVTTSSFQSGATKTAGLSALAGIPIELIDAKRFYEALKLSQCAKEDVYLRNWPPQESPRLQLLHRHPLNSL